MIIIGEKINGSIPSIAEAIANRDAELIKARAIAQEEASEPFEKVFLDCCASVPEAEEVETLKWMIDCIQEVSDLPIAVDSPSPRVLAEAYKFCNKPGLINSVSMEGAGEKIDILFPIVAENPGWDVAALCCDDTGIPKTAEDRLRVFHEIMNTSPLNYLNTTRILQSCILLRTTEESILSISEQVGFRSVSSYNRHFSEIMGTQPSEWRHKMARVDSASILEYTGWMQAQTLTESRDK